MKFLGAVATEDYSRVPAIARGIDYFLKLGTEVGLLNPTNVQLVTGELEGLNAAIAEFSKSAKPAEIDLGRVFSESLAPISTKATKNDGGEEKISTQNEKQEVVKTEYEGCNGDSNNGNGSQPIKSAMRQSAILEIIRQNNNCRMKDIQDSLPEVSERTLRYDLQSLLERGMIERTGNGGPATYYQPKTESLPQPDQPASLSAGEVGGSITQAGASSFQL